MPSLAVGSYFAIDAVANPPPDQTAGGCVVFPGECILAQELCIIGVLTGAAAGGSVLVGGLTGLVVQGGKDTKGVKGVKERAAKLREAIKKALEEGE